MKKITFLCAFFLMSTLSLMAQNYPEPGDWPGTGTGPTLNLVNGTNTITGRLETGVPNDGQDRFQVFVPLGGTITSGTFSITNNGAPTGFMDFNAGGETINFPGGPFVNVPYGPGGTYPVLVAANFAVGNNWTLTLEVDLCSIAIDNITTTATTCPGGSDGTLIVTASCTDCGGPLEYSLDNITYQASNTFTRPADDYTAYVRDTSNNACLTFASATISEGTDTTPPTAMCVGPLTLQLNAAGMASLTAAEVDNGSSDTCGIASISIDKTSFTCADVGANTVTLTVTDNNMNSSTCTTIVTVEDNVAPTAMCVAPFTVQLDAMGMASITAADIDNGSTDVCGIASLSIDNSTFTCADVGTPVTVTLTVTDVNMNSSTCTTTVTVEDNVAPTAMCVPDFTVQLDAMGMASITTADIDNGSSDACGIATLSIDNSTFTCADVGAPVMVTLTVTDNNMNSSTCTTTITVEDNEGPTAMCVAPFTVQLDDMGMASITVADVDNGSTDACGVASTSIDVTNFTCADVGTPVTVTLTVTDVNSNTSTCTTTVTVEDTIDPVFAASVPSPPVGANYTVDNTLTFNYQSIVATGINLGNGDDVAYTATLGAPFTLYSNTVNELRISTNGYISINTTDSGGDLSNDCPLPAVPSTGPDAPRLYVLHDDTDAQPGVTDSGVYYEYFSVSPYPHPNGDLMGASIIEFVGDHFPGSGPTNELQYQSILFDNGDIIYQYLTDPDDGSGATIGAQESGSGLSVTIACNTAGTTVSPGIYGLSPYGGDLSASPTASMGCPVDMVVDTDPGICGAVINYSTPIATDNCGTPTVVQTAGLPTGSTFPFGVTTNTFEATDSNGNTAICTFTVTVEDNAPIIVVSGPVDIFTGTGPSAGDCSTIVNYGPITIDSFVLDDNCGDASTTTLVQTDGLGSGAMFPVGTTTEEFTITDNNGNVTVYTFDVTITDTTLPVVDCPGDLIVSDGGTGVYTIGDYTSTASDNCSAGADLVVTQDPAAGTEVANGSTTTVTVTATDAAGNVTTCEFDILVDSTLGVEDTLFNEASISMYPNPTAGELNILAGNTTIDKVEVYDLSGRLVKSVSFDTTTYQFNLNDMDAAVYLVQIFSGSNMVVKRVIKK